MSVRDVLVRTDLASVLTELAGEPVGTGHRARWRCCAADHPDDNPSVSMFTDHKGTQRWRCWSGDHAGTAVDALMLHHRIDLPTALRELETRAGITPPSPPIGVPTAIRTPPRATISPEALEYIDACAKHLWTPHGAGARRWLHARGLDPNTLRTNLVGYDPGPRHLARPAGLPRQGGVTYVHFNPAGEPIYVQTRHLHPGASHKYTNPTPAHGPIPTLSHPGTVTGVTGPILVTEGVPDGLIATQAGFAAATVISASTVNDRTAQELAVHAQDRLVIVAFDADDAGRTASERLTVTLRTLGTPCKVLRLPAGHDLTSSYHQPPAAATAAAIQRGVAR